MKTTKTAVMLLLSLFIVTAGWADDQSANNNPKPLIIDLDCLDTPQVCREQAAKKEALRQQCTAYPEWCQQWHTNQQKAREEKRALREACKINPNPNRCEQLKGQLKGKRTQRRKKARQLLKKAQQQWCDNNPSVCKQWKADQKKMRQQCQELRRQLADNYPSRPQQY